MHYLHFLFEVLPRSTNQGNGHQDFHYHLLKLPTLSTQETQSMQLAVCHKNITLTSAL